MNMLMLITTNVMGVAVKDPFHNLLTHISCAIYLSNHELCKYDVHIATYYLRIRLRIGMGAYNSVHNNICINITAHINDDDMLFGK